MGIIIHELMHATGFWHEQSRPDRDWYVTVLWKNIQDGMEYNFKKQTWETVSSLGIGYDLGEYIIWIFVFVLIFV